MKTQIKLKEEDQKPLKDNNQKIIIQKNSNVDYQNSMLNKHIKRF
jgi:hypothetical protein